MSAEQGNRLLINTHIEKTAGTSLRSFFQGAVGAEHVAVYDPVTDRLRRGLDVSQTNGSPLLGLLKSTIRDTPLFVAAKELAFVVDRMRNREGLAEIPSDALIIHGHFLADRYDAVVDNPLRSIVFRDPLDRMRSQYDHWSREEGKYQSSWRVQVPYDANMPFEEYAFAPQLQNYQTQAVAGKPLANFDAVGVTENLNPFKRDLLSLFIEQGWCDESVLAEASIPRINQAPKGGRTDTQHMDPAFLRKFRKFHSEDYQLHDAAKRLAEK